MREKIPHHYIYYKTMGQRDVLLDNSESHRRHFQSSPYHSIYNEVSSRFSPHTPPPPSSSISHDVPNFVMTHLQRAFLSKALQCADVDPKVNPDCYFGWKEGKISSLHVMRMGTRSYSKAGCGAIIM